MSSRHYFLGLLGHPVSHSLSPALHNAALAHHKLDGEYKLIDVEASELKATLDQLEADGMRGVNVTIPHKQSVMKFLQELSPDVAAIGAVNTIIFERNDETSVRRGENTDVHGFCTALVEALGADALERATTGDALLYGYGGAARAVVAGLRVLGFHSIKVTGRDQGAIDEFCLSCSATASPWWLDKVCDRSSQAARLGNRLESVDCKVEPTRILSARSLAGVTVLVNATPIGQHGDPITDEFLEVLSNLPKVCFVYDLVYSRHSLSTPLVETCEKLALSACDGSGMLVYQAAKSFELWTGRKGPSDVMKDALRKAIRL